METLIDLDQDTPKKMMPTGVELVEISNKVNPGWFVNAKGKVVEREELINQLNNDKWEKDKAGIFYTQVFDQEGNLIEGRDRDLKELISKAVVAGSLILANTIPSDPKEDWKPQIWKLTKSGKFRQMRLRNEFTFGTAAEWHKD